MQTRLQKRYLEQYQRIKRWYERFKSINNGKIHDIPSDYYQDEVYAFFESCYHLKDWIKNDPSSGISEKEVEKFVDNSPDLKICGDLCNGAKHLIIKRKRIDSDTKIGKKEFSLEFESGPPRISIKYEVVGSDKTKIKDAFELATECLEKWNQFLKQRGLLCFRDVYQAKPEPVLSTIENPTFLI